MIVVVADPTGRVAALARVARIGDRVRDVERDLRHARRHLDLVIGEAINDHAASVADAAAAAGVPRDDAYAAARRHHDRRHPDRPFDTGRPAPIP